MDTQLIQVNTSVKIQKKIGKWKFLYFISFQKHFQAYHQNIITIGTRIIQVENKGKCKMFFDKKNKSSKNAFEPYRTGGGQN